MVRRAGGLGTPRLGSEGRAAWGSVQAPAFAAVDPGWPASGLHGAQWPSHSQGSPESDTWRSEYERGFGGREAHQLPSARPRTLKAGAAVPSEAGGLRAGGGAAAVGPGFPSLRGRSPDVKGRRRRRPRPFCSLQALSGSDEALCWGGGRLYRVRCLKCPSLPGTPSQTPPEM